MIQVKFRAQNIAMRRSFNRSLTTLQALSMTIVTRSFVVYAGQWGSFGLLVEPVPPDKLSAAHGDVGEPRDAGDLAGENLGYMSFWAA
jgi:hypothetical protein